MLKSRKLTDTIPLYENDQFPCHIINEIHVEAQNFNCQAISTWNVDFARKLTFVGHRCCHHLIPYLFIVVEVYQGWCGPCKAINSTFKRLYFDLSDRPLKFYTVSNEHTTAAGLMLSYRGVLQTSERLMGLLHSVYCRANCDSGQSQHNYSGKRYLRYWSFDSISDSSSKSRRSELVHTGP